MAKENYQQFYVEGLQALKTAADTGRDASEKAAANAGDGSPPEIKGMMEAGAKSFGKQADTLAALLSKAGGSPSSKPNAFMDGIQSGSRQMIEAAKDPDVRLASVIGAAQIATHYFIASYGTLASAAKHLGLTEDAATIKGLLDEMKEGDARFTEFAEGQANARAGAAG